MKSQGTKETQGINGDAAALQRQMGAVLKFAGRIGEPCAYERHRPTDWVTPESQVTCGICHPPAAEFPGITRRHADGFDELAAAAAARVVAVARCLTCEKPLADAEARAGAIYCSPCAGERLAGESAEIAIAAHEISLERRGMRSPEDLEDELDQAFDAAMEASI